MVTPGIVVRVDDTRSACQFKIVGLPRGKNEMILTIFVKKMEHNQFSNQLLSLFSFQVRSLKSIIFRNSLFLATSGAIFKPVKY